MNTFQDLPALPYKIKDREQNRSRSVMENVTINKNVVQCELERDLRCVVKASAGLRVSKKGLCYLLCYCSSSGYE